MSYISPGALLALGISLPCLGIGAVCLRFYARLYRKNAIGIDDWLVLPALACMIGCGACLIVGVKKKALGYSTPSAAPEFPGPDGFLYQDQYVIRLTAQLELAMEILQPLSLGFSKLSILFFYRRIFCTARTGFFNLLVIFGSVFVVAWMLAFPIATLFDCGTHIDYIWGPWINEVEHCGVGIELDEAVTVTDFIIDLMIFIMPLPMIWKLHMSTRLRISVGFVFTLGTLAIVVSIIRMAIIFILAEGITSSLTVGDHDLSTAIFLYWTMLEAGLAVIIVCLPTLQVFISKRTTEDIVRSVRSVLSVRSLNSIFSGSSHRKTDAKSINSRSDTSAGAKPSSEGANGEDIEMQPIPVNK